VFIGHTAIALAAKRARPSIPLPALIAAAYGPDVIEITLLALWRWVNVQAAFGSHSIPSVALGAAVVAVAYGMWRRDLAGALLLAAIYASHWIADLFTSTGKPTWDGGPTLGLALYEHPVLDFVIESALLLGAWLFLWPARDRRRQARALRVVAPIALVLVQLVFNAAEPLFGVRSIKGAVSSAPGRGEASSAAITRSDDYRVERTDPLAAWLLHSSPFPSSIERDMADNSGPYGVLTLVCLTCGKEKFYEQAAPPPDVTCDQCGSTVFRQFATPTEPDEATIAQLEEQTRSIAYGDPSPDTLDDARDLDQR
jgi:hypothetical protein